MTNKDKFLQRKFLYDLQCPIAVLLPIIIWYLWLFLLVRIIDVNDSLIGSFVSSTLFLVFGFYNLFTYIWSKKMAEKYGIELFGDLDQEWLRKEQGYDAKIFGEIYSKNLHFRKLGAKSLFITVPLSFLPWPAIPFIVGIIMIVVYMVYRKVYFNDAMADRWPRVYGSGIVISRILDQDSDFGKKDTEKNNEGKNGK
ncbi:MAG: hypothetical protein Q4D29_12180 [Lachnospiraceae bacterium]|nr:hypothetical protein [Lachnospiraceae bacterium]